MVTLIKGEKSRTGKKNFFKYRTKGPMRNHKHYLPKCSLSS